MVSARKRSLHEADGDVPGQIKEAPLLQRIRNMWQFANLCQWILLFGKAVKIDDSFDIDDLEAECLKPYSMVLQEIGLSLLKFLSSHRGLTHELFDEYTRRQYVSKAPGRNPFGDGEVPAKFADFDVFSKIRVLQQMTQFVMMNPDKIREKAQEHKESDQTEWRIEPYGWDRHDRTYYVLDDNRIYRLTEAPPPPPRPKKNSKKAKAAARARKRRRISLALDSDAEDGGDEASDRGMAPSPPEDDGLGGMRWECIAVTLDEVRQFLSTIQKTRDENEKILRDRIQDHLVPILERQEESRKKKQLQREKELLNLEKMAHAKRSSRIAHKIEQQRVEEHAREEERKRHEEEATARKEEQKRLKMERERDNRMMSREQRLREREARRIQHEEELAQLSEDSKNLSNGSGRMSERRLQAEIERNRQALKEIEEEEEDWIFDCICGVYGQIDDGTHSVACEKCNIWQHSKCLGIDEEEAEHDDFHFVCDSCRRREEAIKEQSRPRIIKIKINRPGSSSSPPTQRNQEDPASSQLTSSSQQLVVEIPSRRPPSPTRAVTSTQINGPFGSHGVPVAKPSEAQRRVMPGQDLAPRLPPTAIFKTNVIPTKESTQNPERHTPVLNGSGSNPFSSSHPSLLPPDQSPNKSRAYGTILGQPHGLYNGLAGEIASPIKPKTEPIAESAANLPHPVPGCDVSSAKDHPIPATKSSPVAAPPPNLSVCSPVALSHLNGTSPTLIGTPRFNPDLARPNYDERSSPLPPPSGGLSPQKHSPPLPPQTAISASPAQLAGSSPAPAILPPIAALPPSPRPQDLTPPVKPAEPVRSVPDAPQSVSG